MDFVKKNRNVMIYIGIAFFFMCLGTYSYFVYLKPKVYPKYVENKEFLRKEESKEKGDVDLMLFYTTWCPHSQKAMKEWDAFKNSVVGQKINGYNVHFKSVDCDENEKLSDEFNITGYPTIKLVKSPNEIIEFDAKPTKEALKSFLDTVLK